MKAKNLDNIAEFNPYSLMTEAGATPEQIKEFIILTLERYIVGKDFLRANATSIFAAEAIRVGRLVANPEWRPLFEEMLLVRERVIQEKPEIAAEIFNSFQSTIKEGERQFQLVVSAERRKLSLDLEDFAFEILRNIGALVEAVLQPFLREFCAIIQADVHGSVDSGKIQNADLGSVVSMISQCLPHSCLLAPRPHAIKVNQWRNIAQHHSYTILGEKICLRYGREPNIRLIEVTREEMFVVARELVYRVSIFKGSREISLVNYRNFFRPLMHQVSTSISDRATLFSAAIATQGFELKKLMDDGETVVAEIEDVAEHLGEHRHIHCSQFLLIIGQWSRGKNIQIHFSSIRPVGVWIFTISATDLNELLSLDSPYGQLTERLTTQFSKSKN